MVSSRDVTFNAIKTGKKEYFSPKCAWFSKVPRLRTFALLVGAAWRRVRSTGGHTDRGKLQYLEKNLSKCYFVHLKSHVEWPGIEPGSFRCFEGENWTELHLKACSYRVVKPLRLDYSVNDIWGYNSCLFWDPYIYKCILQAECRIFVGCK
jgi:hypothetical protein